jgi:hypothetical protein
LADPSREIATDPHPLAAELALLNKFSSHALAMRVKEYEGAIHDEKSKDHELELANNRSRGVGASVSRSNQMLFSRK